MNKFSFIVFCLLAMAAFAMGVNDAEARSNFWDGQGECATCHTDDDVSCAGCHAHGVHSDAGKDDINVLASTDKATYTPGETVTVSITGGYRPGWVRAILYNENGVEVDRSEGPGCGTGGFDNGCGGGEEFPGPIVLTAPAPSTPGLYTWEASWYGNEYDLGDIGETTFFGPGWRSDPDNPKHGEEIVFTNPFDVVATGECGDGILDPATEDCDDGAANGSTICGCQTDCTFTATGTGCPDGEFCNGDETCDGVGTCQERTPVVCDDGVGCTDDSCDEAADACVFSANDASCDNGQFCDGSETCDAVNDCQPGTPVVVDDGVGCTDDSCDEVNDVVVNAPNDSLCDDGAFCNGSETCDATDDCQGGTAPCDPATETCDEAGDTCEPIPAVVDLDLVQFKVTKKVSLTRVKPVILKLVVKNQGTVEGSAVARITGMQNEAMVYDEILDVTDAVGNGRTTYDDDSDPPILPYEPIVAGDILWSVTMVDGDPDIDEITAVTTVTP